MRSSDTSSNAPSGSRARHILLLDDEDAICQAYSMMLDLEGHKCTTATTGEELLEIIQHARGSNVRYDLAVLDIKIFGGMGGIETLQRMRQLGCDIPVISMSGYPAADIFANEDERIGFLAHLQKPFSNKKLLGEIERICTSSSTKQIGNSPVSQPE